MTELNKRYLTKTSFMYGKQCHKRLYLQRFHHESADPVEEGQQSFLDTGQDVGLVARGLFPGGKDINPMTASAREPIITNPHEFPELMVKYSVFYEATFWYDNLKCAVDILVKEDNGWHAYEVKATNSLKDIHLEDAAFQYYVLKNYGLDIVNFSVVYLNRAYVRKGELNLQKLFIKESVLEQMIAEQENIAATISELRGVLGNYKIPDIAPGKQCNKPYPCNFQHFCNIDISEPPPINRKEKAEVDKEAVTEFLAGLKYPLYFFDFETVMYSIPEFENSSPYQQIPFQYSLHIRFKTKFPQGHAEFIGDGQVDPRPDLIERMLFDLEEAGTILTWNKSFEITCLKNLAKNFPQYKEPIEKIIDKIQDLMTPFKKKWVTHSGFNGSASIKAVLPVLIPELSYQDLNIQEGGTASISYAKMKEASEWQQEQTTRDLLPIATSTPWLW